MYTFSHLTAAFALLSACTAAPFSKSISKRSFSCDSLATGLTYDDCQHMSSIGIAGQGENSGSSNGNIWLGSDGDNTFTFHNNGSESVNIIVWYTATGDYVSSFVNVRAPKISYSLTKPGDNVTVSVANGVSGGWAALYNKTTTLSSYGQINNTWGEFTTGSYATFDVSREVNMAGNNMTIEASTGCVSDMDTCVFVCNSGVTCGDSGSYSLVNCEAESQTGASYGLYAENPEGGCQGWSDGGELSIYL